MSLYTFVLDYQGGTYISQRDGDDLTSAARTWVRSLRSVGDFELTDTDRSELEGEIERHGAVAIDGVRNVWCLTGGLRNRLLLAHVILTETRGSPSDPSSP